MIKAMDAGITKTTRNSTVQAIAILQVLATLAISKLNARHNRISHTLFGHAKLPVLH